MDGNIDILDLELPKPLVAAGAPGGAVAAAPSSTSSSDSSSLKTIRMKRISKLAEDLSDPDVRVTSPGAASASSDSLEWEEKRYSASRSDRASLSEVYGAFSLTKQPRTVLTTSPGPSSGGSGVAIPRSRSTGARSPSSPSIPVSEISARRVSALADRSATTEHMSREPSRSASDKDEEGTRIDSLASLVESASRSRAKSSFERERRAASRDRAGLTKKTSGVETPPVVSPAPTIIRKVSKLRVAKPTSPEVESAELEGKDPKSPSASASFSYFDDEPSVAPSITSKVAVASTAPPVEIADTESGRSTLKRMRKKLMSESGLQKSKRGLAVYDDQD